mgnify:CR=1 FL=1
MLITIFGESCTGKSTLADALKERTGAQVYSGKDYLRLAKSEGMAKALFQKQLKEAAAGEGDLIYVIAEPELLAVMNRINGSLIYSAPSVSQRAAIQALAMRKEIREKYVTAYRDRIFYAADRIEKIPYLSLVRPKGTFYLFPGVEKTGLDEKAFCKVLLDQAHVLVSPGTPFGVSAAGHFRIACTVGIDQLKTAFDRMEKLSF